MTVEDNWHQAPKFLKVLEQSLLENKGHDPWGNDKFHLSDAAGCSRRTFYRISIAKNPSLVQEWGLKLIPESIQSLMTLSIGHAVHATLQDKLVNMLGWCTWDDIEVSLALPELNLKGSIDAVIPIDKYTEACDHFGIPANQRGGLDGSHFIVDIKTKKDSEKSRYVTGSGIVTTHTFPTDIITYPEPKYYTQIQSYMYLSQKLYPERYPDVRFGIFLYACKNDGRLFCICVSKDETVGMAVEQKAKAMQIALETNVAPPREYGKNETECCGYKNDKGVFTYSPCPYKELCWRGV